MFDLLVRNLDLDREYPFALVMGYYFPGFRYTKGGTKTVKVPIKKASSTMLNSIESVQREKQDEGSIVNIILNDASPLSVEAEKIVEAVGKEAPLIYITLHNNVGCGGKENILQYLGSKMARYVVRLDADVKVTSPILSAFSRAFQDHNDLFVATMRAGFLGGMIGDKPAKEGKLYVETAQIGNGTCIKSENFQKIGFSDPLLRFFDDLDLVYRARYEGFQSLMVLDATGTTVSSGAGQNTFFRQVAAQYLAEVNPLVDFSLRQKDGMPIIRYMGERREQYLKNIYFHRSVPASPIARALMGRLRQLQIKRESILE